MEAKRIQEEALKKSFRSDAVIWNETKRRSEKVSDKLWDLSQGIGTKSRNLMNDWGTVLALAEKWVDEGDK